VHFNQAQQISQHIDFIEIKPIKHDPDHIIFDF